MESFLEAIEPQQVTVVLGGQPVVVHRSRLGLHMRLAAIDIVSAPGPVELSEAICKYFDLLEIDISQASPVEILTAFAQLRELNTQKWLFPFQKNTGEKKEPESFDYPDRDWAVIVTKVAHYLGWSKEEIFSCHLEEFLCYYQEVLVIEQAEKEWEYSLSEIAYVYDSNSKKSNLRPLAKPGWMYSQELPKPVKILRSMLPYGVLSLAGEEVEYHH